MTAFDRSFDADEQYDLLFEDGSTALFMPGMKDFFELEKYRFELGRDYKRITFYLCTQCDIDLSEGVVKSSYEDEMVEDVDSCVQPIEKAEGNTESVGGAQGTSTDQDEVIARQLQHEWNEEFDLTSTSSSPELKDTGSATHATDAVIRDKQDVIQALSSKVERNEQFFITTRRKAPLSRILSLWRRQAKKKSPTYRIMVQYSGEAGIDSGAIAKEFLEDAVDDITATLFKDGVPVNSTHHVQNGDFRTCGELAAASLAQGRPPPCFLDECAYKSIFAEIDLTKVDEKDLTEKEKLTLDTVRLDCTKHSDFILDNGYTGVVHPDFIEDIVNSLKVKFVSNRMLYMQEFKKGLDIYGLGNIIENNPDICRSLFVGDFKNDFVPDADYLFSLMKPIYSEEGSTKRVIEESVMDYLQDVLIAVEDTPVSGYSTAVAWNYENEEGENVSTSKEMFQTPDISVGGIMGWLIGQRHKHILSKEKPTITINFDHNCLVRNPDHKVCFPLIGACCRELTIPVVHMNNPEKFRELFILAYCKGQAFGKP